MQKKRYNIAFLPDAKHHAAYQRYAQDNLKECGVGTYMLGNGVLPHMTVCQFYCADPALLDRVWQAANTELDPMVPDISGLAMHQKQSAGVPAIQVELSVKADQQLFDKQKRICTLLSEFGLESLTPPAPDYRPHMTLGIIMGRIPDFAWPQGLLGTASGKFHPTIGLSDEEGQYLKILKHSAHRSAKPVVAHGGPLA